MALRIPLDFMAPFATKQVQETIYNDPCSIAKPGQLVADLETAPEPCYLCLLPPFISHMNGLSLILQKRPKLHKTALMCTSCRSELKLISFVNRQLAPSEWHSQWHQIFRPLLSKSQQRKQFTMILVALQSQANLWQSWRQLLNPAIFTYCPLLSAIWMDCH